MLEVYLNKPYRDGAMGPDAYNCWGLVRAVRHEVFGLGLLPEFGGKIAPCRGSQRDYLSLSAMLELCNPEPAAIAAAFKGGICAHVGIVVQANGLLMILETNEKTGPRLIRVADFCRQYTRILFYRDQHDCRNLSE